MRNRIFILAFLLLADIGAGEQGEAPDKAIPLAVRWLHTSAEHQAIVRQTYALASDLLRDKIEGRASGTWAVALDADETVLSNSLYEWELASQNLQSTIGRWDAWVKRQAASPMPGVIEFLELVHELGGRIAIVTNRFAVECPDTEANFRKHAIPYDIMLCRENEREKEPRWDAIQYGTASPDWPPLEILLWIGDNIRDFPDLDQESRFNGSESFSLFGRKYLLIPNPVHGSWKKNVLPLVADDRPDMQATEQHFSRDIIKHAEVDYRIYLPEGYAERGKPWPLLLWLHGDGGQASRGGWNEILSYGPPSMIKNGRKLPFVILTPQLWGEVHWDPDTLHSLLLETIQNYNVDEDRVVVMGYSRGGFGSWELATSYPKTFAAVVPISARPMTAIERVRDMGVWIFHGELDTGVPVGGALNMHEELLTLGADVRLTLFPGVGHGAVNPAMATDELWEWLLAQKR